MSKYTIDEYKELARSIVADELDAPDYELNDPDWAAEQLRSIVEKPELTKKQLKETGYYPTDDEVAQ